MEPTTGFVGLACVECGATVDPEANAGRCPACGGILEGQYDLDAVDVSRERLEERRFDSLWRYEELLPLSRPSAVTVGEGATPLVDAPALAEAFDVGRLLVKDEGQNPTGTVVDREQSVAVTAARDRGATTVALPSTGNGGQSASAYAGGAGLDAEVFVPSRTGFSTKAMVNVHGGEMSVVEGRLEDAIAAFEDAREADWHSLAPEEAPYRVEGAKTLAFEIAEQLEWATPDAVVHATGSGTGLRGLARGFDQARQTGLIADRPALYAAQAEGCAPVVRAIEEDRDELAGWQHPDTICGGIEVPNPAGGDRLLAALRDGDGGGVATDDDAILEAAVSLAETTGIEATPAGAAAASGARALADRGVLGPEDTVVVINRSAGTKEADVLRSHLMRRET